MNTTTRHIAAAVAFALPRWLARRTPPPRPLSAPSNKMNAGDLNVGYVDEGPANGPVVILLHGWPYDINSYVDVVPKLTAQGYRVIVPHLRGYGTTRFLDANTPRNGEPAALAADVIALMDALKIDKATLAGYDWGARTADIVAALWPQRVKGLVSVSGYLIGSQEAGKQPLPPEAGTAMVVSVLLRHRAWPHRLRKEPPRLRQVDLEAGVAAVEV
jgi:pimeloyl-ACP methyl ester carboxylesterase